MKYATQTQESLDRLDQALAQLRGFIKRGQNKEIVEKMRLFGEKASRHCS